MKDYHDPGESYCKAFREVPKHNFNHRYNNKSYVIGTPNILQKEEKGSATYRFFVLLFLFVSLLRTDGPVDGGALLLHDRLALGVGGALLLQLLPALLLVLRLALLLRLLPALLVLQTGGSGFKSGPVDPEYGFESEWIMQGQK